MAKTFINNTRDDMTEVLSSMNIRHSMVEIIISDSGSDIPVYNTIPYGGESSSTMTDIPNKVNRIVFSLDDVSGFCHELAHVLDYETDEQYKMNKSFEAIKSHVTKYVNELYTLLDDLGNNLNTRPEQRLYENSDNELFAHVLNQQFCRTHGTNVYADQLKPVLIDLVLDDLYVHDDQFKQLVDQFTTDIKELNNWTDPVRVSVINEKYLIDDHEALKDALETITNNQLEL